MNFNHLKLAYWKISCNLAEINATLWYLKIS